MKGLVLLAVLLTTLTIVRTESPIRPYIQQVKPGSCPEVKKGIVGICVERCTNDGDCKNSQKCCSNGCGHTCTDPVIQNPCEKKTCPPGKRCTVDTSLCKKKPCKSKAKCVSENPGKCPAVKAKRGCPRRKVKQCKNDEECKVDQKCCKDRCGNKVCTKPVSETCEQKKCPRGQRCTLKPAKCVRSSCPLIAECLANKEVCELPKKPGHCRGSFPRYYYNNTECEQFIYGGCGGNANNFKTEEECKKICKPECKEGEEMKSSDPCEHCRCMEGNLQCRRILCDVPECENGTKPVKLKETCCPSCPKRCEQDGKTHKHGESFKSSDGCNQCNCNDGQIACTEKACPGPQECALVDCLPLDCTDGIQPITPPGQCCPVCPPDCSLRLCAKPVCPYGVEPETQPGQCCPECPSDPRCEVDGMFYQEGPFYRNNDTCQPCFCKKGHHECASVDCPPLQCDHSVQIDGKCCPRCPDGTNCRTSSGEIISAGKEVRVGNKMCSCPKNGSWTERRKAICNEITTTPGCALPKFTGMIRTLKRDSVYKCSTGPVCKCPKDNSIYEAVCIPSLSDMKKLKNLKKKIKKLKKKEKKLKKKEKKLKKKAKSKQDPDIKKKAKDIKKKAKVLNKIKKVLKKMLKKLRKKLKKSLKELLKEKKPEKDGGSGPTDSTQSTPYGGSGPTYSTQSPPYGGSGPTDSTQSTPYGGSGPTDSTQSTPYGGSGPTDSTQSTPYGGSGPTDSTQSTPYGGSGGSPSSGSTPYGGSGGSSSSGSPSSGGSGGSGSSGSSYNGGSGGSPSSGSPSSGGSGGSGSGDSSYSNTDHSSGDQSGSGPGSGYQNETSTKAQNPVAVNTQDDNNQEPENMNTPPVKATSPTGHYCMFSDGTIIMKDVGILIKGHDSHVCTARACPNGHKFEKIISCTNTRKEYCSGKYEKECCPSLCSSHGGSGGSNPGGSSSDGGSGESYPGGSPSDGGSGGSGPGGPGDSPSQNSNCAAVACFVPDCSDGATPITPSGQCCPVCPLGSIDCAAVKCRVPQCPYGVPLVTSHGQCCPVCSTDKPTGKPCKLPPEYDQNITVDVGKIYECNTGAKCTCSPYQLDPYNPVADCN